MPVWGLQEVSWSETLCFYTETLLRHGVEQQSYGTHVFPSTSAPSESCVARYLASEAGGALVERIIPARQ